MPRFLPSVCIFVVIAPGSALAQMNPSDVHMHGAFTCNDSPTPGKRPPNTDCAILVHKNFSTLPSGPLVWRFENFPTPKAAQDSTTPASVVVEAAGKVWLLTLSSKGGRSKGGTLVVESELLPPIPPGPGYEIVVAEIVPAVRATYIPGVLSANRKVSGFYGAVRISPEKSRLVGSDLRARHRSRIAATRK